MRKHLNEKAYSLIGIDGNAYCIMGYVSKAMRECGRTKAEIDAYVKDATSGNYDNLLMVSVDMIEILNSELGYEDDYQMTKPGPNDWENAKPGFNFNKPDEDDLDIPPYEEV